MDIRNNLEIDLGSGNNVQLSIFRAGNLWHCKFEYQDGGVRTTTVVKIEKSVGYRGGRILFFVCPHTGRKSRVLYFKRRTVVSRYGITKWCYFRQTLSATDRIIYDRQKKEIAIKKVSLSGKGRIIPKSRTAISVMA